MEKYLCLKCGGEIYVQEGAKSGTCDYCEATSTLPSTHSEEFHHRIKRANDFIKAKDFTEAISAYKDILNMGATDHEVHWGLVLAKYGIEYVEDPVSHKRIPTFHRLNTNPILTDADYLAALKHADSFTKRQYEQYAQEISEIQKRMLAVANSAEKYDVFICYKKTERDGKTLTKDSLRAREVYHELDKRDYRVFFAEITLDGKLGVEYEPYIYAALNSAKVFLALGTSKEHFESTWVKNEWSRYLVLKQEDPSLLLVPCFEGMDAYDIPIELSGFQAKDMSKPGFALVLADDVKRVLDTYKTKEASHAPASATAAVETVESLTDYAYTQLQLKKWENAKDEFTKVLRVNAKYAPAYVGLYCVEKQISGIEKSNDGAIKLNENIRLALQNANPAYRAELEKQIEAVNIRLAQQNYGKLVSSYKVANSEKDFAFLAEQFGKLGSYEDARALSEECRGRVADIKMARLEASYGDLRARREELDSSRNMDQRKEAQHTKRYTKLSAEFSSLGNDFRTLGNNETAQRYAADCLEQSEECTRQVADVIMTRLKASYDDLHARREEVDSSKNINQRITEYADLSREFSSLGDEFSTLGNYEDAEALSADCKRQAADLIIARLILSYDDLDARRKELDSARDMEHRKAGYTELSAEFSSLGSEFNRLGNNETAKGYASACLKQSKSLVDWVDQYDEANRQAAEQERNKTMAKNRRRTRFRIIGPIAAIVPVLLGTFFGSWATIFAIIPWFIMYRMNGRILKTIIFALIAVPSSAVVYEGGGGSEILGLLLILSYLGACVLTYIAPAD